VVPAGQKATVQLTVGHQIGAPATAISTVTAQVSFDDGKTWTTVPVTKANGGYQLSYAQPALSATSGFASLRVTAADADGSSVDQTILRAYPLAVLAPPASSGTQNVKPDQPHACGGPVPAPYVQCMAIVNTSAPKAAPGNLPTGYGPADITSAYNLPDTGAGQTIAIVDAYDDPNAEADLATYRSTYGLPPCTTANGCFRKVNQQGAASPLPSPDSGWGVEISLDLDMVSAACPKCHILLVEANSESVADLGPSVDTAVSLGANVVSNSYGSRGEFSGEQDFNGYYHHPHVPIVVATGDYGYGNGAQFINSIAYPAAAKNVIAVGGTSLTKDSSSARGWTESAWSGSTSGCSAYIDKPSWQKDKLCDMRTIADISAVADPNTGVAVNDTFGQNGWMVVGGTSAATPIIASVFALAGNAALQHYAAGLYAYPGHFNDVITGSNGDDCSGTYLCNAVPGYDGPTGLGTPNGTGGF
jgi:subtilase family serine protease